MKLSVISDEVTQSLPVLLDFARRHALDAVELRSIDNLPIDQLSPERARELQSRLGAQGLTVCALSSSFYKCSLDDPEELLRQQDKLDRLLRLADIFRCTLIRGFAFFRSGDFMERLEEITARLEAPLERMKRAGAQLLLECDPSVFTVNHSQLAVLLTRLSHPSAGAIYDPGNVLFAPGGASALFPDDYMSIRPFIRHVHCKDAVRSPDGTAGAVRVGAGQVPYPSIFAALREDGYKGFVSLETHYRLHREISEEQMTLPWGEAFSQGGEPASDESMTALRAMLPPPSGVRYDPPHT